MGISAPSGLAAGVEPQRLVDCLVTVGTPVRYHNVGQPLLPDLPGCRSLSSLCYSIVYEQDFAQRARPSGHD